MMIFHRDLIGDALLNLISGAKIEPVQSSSREMMPLLFVPNVVIFMAFLIIGISFRSSTFDGV